MNHFQQEIPLQSESPILRNALSFAKILKNTCFGGSLGIATAYLLKKQMKFFLGIMSFTVLLVQVSSNNNTQE